MKARFLFILLIISILSNFSFAQNNLATRTVTRGLDTPWEILWAPDNQIWVSERFGRISRVNPTTGVITPLLTVNEVRENGEGGMMGMVLDANNGRTQPDLYLAYTYNNAGGNFRKKIVRYQFDGNALVNPTTILDNITAANIHNGCRLVILPDRKLYLTTGDAAATNTPQNVGNLNGKVLRINLDGSIPSDNPVANSLVWSWGHRNAQGLVYVPSLNALYSSEHGASTNDELNLIAKGRNYGWPNVEGACDQTNEQNFCRDSNVVQPLSSWTPTLGVAGIDYYGQNLIPEWRNSILLTALSGRRLVVLNLSTDGQRVTNRTTFFDNTFGRLRDVCVAPDGRVFLAVSNRDGRGTPTADDDRIIEIKPTTTNISEKTPQFRLFPNPTNGILTVETAQKIAALRLFDLNGRLILTERGKNQINLGQNGTLAKGLYFLEVEGENERILGREKVLYGKE